MNVTEAIKEYFEACPYLDDLYNAIASVNVDFLPEDGTTYSIEPTPCDPVVSEYIGGGSIRRFTFNFAVRTFYNDEIANNINNCGFFENIQEWIIENSENGVLPELEEGLTPLELNIIKSGYLYGITPDMTQARYQISVQFIYEKEN